MPRPPTSPQDVYIPVPGTCEHVMLQGKEEFRLQMELSFPITEFKELVLDYLDGPN